VLRSGLEFRDIDLGGASLKRRYVGPSDRQVHLIEGGTENPGTPLWCLHATAYSGRSFAPFLQAMAVNRRTVAADTPGYGGSDAPPNPWTIGDYADAMDKALDAADEFTVDLLGYHTGAIVAAELARRRPDRIRRMILIGVPYFSPVDQLAWKARLAAPSTLSDRLEQFQDRWNYFITNRDPGVSLSRGFDNFVDELRAYPHEWWAHEAAFTFDVQTCFSSVRQPVLVLNPDNHLAGASRHAAAVLENAQILEMPNLQNGIFDNAPDELAVLINAFLMEQSPSNFKARSARSA
jgi:pimeloyl-ACP methyl ester carboxylesterase